MNYILDIINIITAVVTIASIGATITPTKKDDLLLVKIKPIIDALALNFGHAKK